MSWRDAAWRAIEAARAYVGATAPNPPVGAAVLSVEGEVLGVGAHRAAGQPHAEVEALAACRERGERPHGLFVTLEPCNHHGRMPPCTAALIAAGVRSVAIGAIDPNSKVAGGGAVALRAAGVEVRFLAESPDPDERLIAARSAALIGPYVHWLATGRPYLTVKRVLDAFGRMEPPPGRKTFASPRLLEAAHRLRREADALLTGSGTILADQPDFTVRHGVDLRTIPRALLIADRRRRVDKTYLEAARKRGLSPHIIDDIDSELGLLGAAGVHQVLVEAGPSITRWLLDRGDYNRLVTIRHISDLEEEVMERLTP